MSAARQIRIVLGTGVLVTILTVAAFLFTPVEHVSDYEAVRAPPGVGQLDFPIFWASWRLTVAGVNPYEEASFEEALGITGPVQFMAPAPWGLLLIAPFGAFELKPAFVAFQVTSFFLFVAGVFLAWPLFWAAPISRLQAAAGLTLAPAVFCIFLGQLTLVHALSVIGALRLMRSGAPLLAGACLSLLVMKPHLAFLLFVMLLIRSVTDRQVRAVVYGIALGTAIQVLVIVALRPGIVAEWMHWLATTDRLLQLAVPTLPSMVRKVVSLRTGHVADWPNLIFPLLAIVGVVWAVTSVRDRPISFTRWVLVLLPASLVLAPYSMVYDQSILLVCHIALIVDVIDRDHWTRPIAIVALHIAYLGLLVLPFQHWHLWYPLLVLVAMLRPSQRWSLSEKLAA